MSTGSARKAALRGARDSAPFLLVLIPFGLLFGVLSSEAGLSFLQTLAMTLIVFAGAAQFTALGLMQEGAPVIIVVLTALAVNLRMAFYSAALTPHLGAAPMPMRILIAYWLFDQTYGAASVAFAKRDMTLDEKIGYYLGAGIVVSTGWVSSSLLGAVGGTRIPDSVPLDFAIPITFIALFSPLLRDRAHIAAAAVSVVGALLLAGVPWSLGLLIAAACAMLTGALVEGRGARND